MNAPLQIIATELLGIETEVRDMNTVLQLRQVLRERDEALRYEHEYGADAYGGPRALMCGCRPGKWCEEHSRARDRLEEIECATT